MKKMLRLVCIALCVVLCSAMAACDTAGGGDVNALTVWTVAPIRADYKDVLKVSPKDKQSLFTKDIIEKFQADNNCKITLQNRGFGDKLNEALMPALNAGTAGDIVPGEMYLNAYYKTGKLEELTFSDEVKNDFVDQVYDRMRYNGKIYSMPMQTGVMSLNINKKALREFGVIDAAGQPTDEYAGLNPLAPATWEELLEICEKIKASVVPDKGGMLISKTTDGAHFRWLPVMRTAGGDFVNDKGEIDVGAAENQKAFEMIRSLSQTSPDGSINSQNEDALHKYFWDSKACYLIEGSDIMARRYQFASKFTDVAKDVVCAELPVFEGVDKHANVLVGTLYFSITKNCKNKPLAKKFLDYLLSDYVQDKLVDADYRIPIRKSTIAKEKAKTQGNATEMDPFFNAVTDAKYDFKGGLPDFERGSANIWSKWNVFTAKVLGTEDSITGLMNTVQTDMKKEFEKYNK